MTETQTAAPMLAFFGNATLKANLLREIAEHERLDQIVKGHYGEMNGKFTGCAIGCALHSLNRIKGKKGRAEELARVGSHERFPEELGIPVELAYVIDTFFENLPQADALTWPRRVIEAVSPGANLDSVMPKLLQWSILSETHGWMAFAKTEEQRAVVQRFSETVVGDWNGETVTDADWDQLTDDLDTMISKWARAGARAGAWARARARAWARAGAWAGADWYQAASLELIRLLSETQG